jgi:hypothetical protein
LKVSEAEEMEDEMTFGRGENFFMAGKAGNLEINLVRQEPGKILKPGFGFHLNKNYFDSITGLKA